MENVETAETKKPRAPQRRLRATPTEFVQALVDFGTTKRIAAHFGVSEHTVSMQRARLRALNVNIPKAPRRNAPETLSLEAVAELNAILSGAE